MRETPLVSVVILNHNGLRYLGFGLKECIDSVLATDYPNLEMVLVDNGSTDGSISFIRENFRDSGIKVIENLHNLGFAGGFNSGIKASKGTYIALLSNDMTVDPNWLNPIINLMENEPQIGIAGFKRMAYGTKNIIDGIGGNLYLCGRARPVGAHEIDRGQYDTFLEDLEYIGGALVIKRKTLQEVGLFDPDYIVFSEDVDLCYRVRKQGYKTVYVPEAVLWHRGSATFKGMDPAGRDLVEYMSERSRIRFIIIHFAPLRLISAFVIDLACILISNPTSKRMLLKAYLWNLKNIATTLRRRLHYGPTPNHCRFPVMSPITQRRRTPSRARPHN